MQCGKSNRSLILSFILFHYFIEIDECASSPCGSYVNDQSICVTAIDSYSCQCAKGYTGYNCLFGNYASISTSKTNDKVQVKL